MMVDLGMIMGMVMVGLQQEGESIGGPGPVEERKKEELCWLRQIL